jgi:hypothetical protein
MDIFLPYSRAGLEKRVLYLNHTNIGKKRGKMALKTSKKAFSKIFLKRLFMSLRLPGGRTQIKIFSKFLNMQKSRKMGIFNLLGIG